MNLANPARVANNVTMPTAADTVLVCSQCWRPNAGVALACSHCGAGLTAAEFGSGVNATATIERERRDDVRPRSQRPSATKRSTVSRDRLPMLQEPFVSNAFRTLRLSASASNAEIRNRVEEARIEARLSSGSGAESRLDALTKAQVE